MSINVKVPNCGWQSENLADWGTGRISMSEIYTVTVEVPVKTSRGEKRIATVYLEKSPSPSDGEKFHNGFVSIRDVEISEIDETGNPEAPYARGVIENYKLVE